MQRSPPRHAGRICKDSYSSQTARTQRPWNTLIRPTRTGWMAMARTAARLACIGFLACASLSAMTCGLFFQMVGLKPLHWSFLVVARIVCTETSSTGGFLRLRRIWWRTRRLMIASTSVSMVLETKTTRVLGVTPRTLTPATERVTTGRVWGWWARVGIRRYWEDIQHIIVWGCRWWSKGISSCQRWYLHSLYGVIILQFRSLFSRDNSCYRRVTTLSSQAVYGW